jgi:leader peptidase (prepilin peptidase)/N-methyltransferase
MGIETGVLFVFGLLIGSFLNVCVYRIPRGLSVVAPRSFCPACARPLDVLSLIPLAGYFLRGGRCRYCRAKISPRYPAVELLSGVLWAGLWHFFGLSVLFWCYGALFSVLLAVFFIDAEWLIIPNGLVLAAMLPAAVLVLRHLFRPVWIYGSAHPLAPFLGLIPGTVFFLVVYIAARVVYKSDRAIGMGDVKLFIPIGLSLGFRVCLLAVVLSVCLGGLTGIVLMLTRKKSRKDAIPMGPFIVIGAAAALLILLFGY